MASGKFKVLDPLCQRLVFVYGTLKRNERSNCFLTNSENGFSIYRCNGVTAKKYPLVVFRNLPYVLMCPGEGHHIKGEVYEVDHTMLTNLDVFEGHPHRYHREMDSIRVKDIDSETNETMELDVRCWMYFLKLFNPDFLLLPRLESYDTKGKQLKQT